MSVKIRVTAGKVKIYLGQGDKPDPTPAPFEGRITNPRWAVGSASTLGDIQPAAFDLLFEAATDVMTYVSNTVEHYDAGESVTFHTIEENAFTVSSVEAPPQVERHKA